jgi:hypothetical protein
LAETRSAVPCVEQPWQGVHHADRVGPSIERDKRHPAEVRKHGRQFRDEWKISLRTAGGHDPANAAGFGAKFDSPGRCVGAGQIQLKSGNTGAPLQSRYNFSVLFNREPNDVDQYMGSSKVVVQPGKVFGAHPIDTRIGESDGVQHTARKLGGAWRGVAVARLQGDRLRDQAAETVEVHYAIELTPESGGACSKK